MFPGMFPGIISWDVLGRFQYSATHGKIAPVILVSGDLKPRFLLQKKRR